MIKFGYRAKDWGGKMIRGELEAISRQNVVESLKNNGLIPLEIREKKMTLIDEFFGKIFHRTGLKQVTGFTRQLSTMMTAGLALTDALNLLREQMVDDKGMYEMIDYCLNAVRGGLPLGTALEKYQKVFAERKRGNQRSRERMFPIYTHIKCGDYIKKQGNNQPLHNAGKFRI